LEEFADLQHGCIAVARVIEPFTTTGYIRDPEHLRRCSHHGLDLPRSAVSIAAIQLSGDASASPWPGHARGRICTPIDAVPATSKEAVW
jgi:hypothetical protein